MFDFFKRNSTQIDVIAMCVWAAIGVCSIGVGFKKLLNNNSFNESLLDSPMVAIIFIFCGVIILMTLWIMLKRNSQE
ncbi:hypothetical protein GJX44_21340 [Salmonella enterica]|nr:hypothetical protein [Salmonella enterica]